MEKNKIHQIKFQALNTKCWKCFGKTHFCIIKLQCQCIKHIQYRVQWPVQNESENLTTCKKLYYMYQLKVQVVLLPPPPSNAGMLLRSHKKINP